MANTIDLSQFHEVFFEESMEGLDVMESGLLGMDLNSPNEETINNVFRAAHSIKGGAGTFGFQEVTDYTHVLETLLDSLRSGELQLSDELIQLLLESVDFLKHMLQECQAGRTVSEQEIQVQVDRLNSFDGNASASNSGSPDAEPATAQTETPAPPTADAPWTIDFKTTEGFFRTGNDPYRILRELTELGKVNAEVLTDKLPVMSQLKPEDCHLHWKLELSNSTADEAEIREIFDWVIDDAEITISRGDEMPVKFSTEETRDDPPSAPNLLGDPAETPAARVRKEGTYQQQTQEVTSIRVNIDRVDMLVNLVGELVITQSMISRFKEHEATHGLAELIRGIEQLEENTRELQEHTMRIRMLPIDNVFQRMPRLVRDLSKSLDKEVNLELRGNATEVDKTVLEKISDPLTHLVRNSLDHGIETPQERMELGKFPEGLVEISAFHEGGSIVIQVKDDGRGLNRERIYQKAVEKEIIEPGTELSDSEIEMLVFSAGFSTATEVSDVSGRGVGMDVVKNNIEQLNGHIEVSSEEGAGSTFTIKLPLTLAIIEGQLVRVGNDVFIVPLLSIVKSTQIDDEEHKVIGGESSMYKLEEDYIPIVSLKDVYRIDADYTNATEGILVIVDSVERFGILVDEVLGQQQVVVKSLEANFKEIPTISGATILGDGTVAMILDMAGLLRESRSESE
ncbi:MAG: chemotaxis protein CheA [Pseudomonadales bacterium]|nr:chemotaxis protein CheA [Pseudomonadales bacterium]MBO7004293.1 chemotaxis protein CheA [Pseudomonadales bacterium]